MFISIAGNIGSGKTTLTKLLSKHFNLDPIYVDEEVNPYLNDFYKDMQRWSFNLQVYFLCKRFSKIYEKQQTKKSFIQDRSIYEDAQIFAPNLQSMGLMTTRDSDTYYKLFNFNEQFIHPPDLMIYLHGSVDILLKQIKERGNEYESDLIEDYLERLNKRYEEWSQSYNKSKILFINLEKNNFNTNKEHLNKIINKVKDVQIDIKQVKKNKK